MKRYAALLRGINISGKNKLSMSELKECLKKSGFDKVITYLNSGNVIFSYASGSETTLVRKLEELIKDKFALDIPVFVTDIESLSDILCNAPDWWGGESKELYDNLIFVMPPATAEEISDKIGSPTEKLERIHIYKNTIFWTFDRQNYSKANWWKKTASAGIGEMITIRTANTVRKIVDLGNKS
jgi:uncharacterized protein (DUF1697 family)